MTLLNGIRIDKITLPKVNIEQFYIKLDKKLIVDIAKVQIAATNKNETSLSEIKNILNYLPHLYMLFDSVSIKDFKYDNKEFKFLYKDEVFYINSDYISLDAQVKPWEKNIEVKIKNLFLKDWELRLKGNLLLNLKNKQTRFQGNFSTFNIDGSLNLDIKNNILNYKISTQKFKTLKPFMDFLSKKIDLEPLIGAWIYKKIIADTYKLNYLEGKFNLKTNDYYPNEMKAKANVKNAAIKFDKNAPVAIGNDLDVILKNDTLIFDIQKATYESKDVSKSDVYIYHLMTKGAGIIVNIKAHTILDDSIHKILRAYDIHVPIIQHSGLTEANVKLDISFEPIEVKSYTGDFLLKDSNISISGVQMYSKKAQVKLDNDLIYIKNANLKYKSIFDLNTSGVFNTKNSTYKSQNHINSLHVKLGKTKLLDITNFETNSKMKIDKNVDISLDDLNATLKFGKLNEINVKNLKNLKKYSDIMKKLNIEDSDVYVKTNDFKNYNILADIKNIDLPILKNRKKLKKLKMHINTDGKNFSAISEDKFLKIEQKDFLSVYLDNLDIALDFSKINSSNNEISDIQIDGRNSNIKDTNSSKKLLSLSYKIKINNGNLYLDSFLFNQELHVKKTNNLFYVESKNLSDIFINSLIGENDFENGIFGFKFYGKDLDNFRGNFKATNTTLKRMSFYNNLIATINTIPSLLTFKTPGFNEKGFSINSMDIKFQKNGDFIDMSKITIDGKSTDIEGYGKYNLLTDEITLSLKLSILKSFSSLVKNIPVFNYIILGDDDKLYTQIDVSGTASKPIIKTNILKDSASSPLNMIKRTIQAPFKLFEN